VAKFAVGTAFCKNSETYVINTFHEEIILLVFTQTVFHENEKYYEIKCKNI
jgi:hypothetical protein